MDRNLFLAFALSFGVLLLWTMLVEPPKPRLPSEEPAASETPAVVAESGPSSPLESLPPPVTPAQPPSESAAAAEPALGAPSPGYRIPLETELYRAELDTRGAGLARWELKKFRSNRREGSEPIVLTTGDAPYDLALVTPFQELGFGDLSNAVFQLERQEGLEFDFSYARAGVTVRKHYRFRPDSYAFDLRVTVENGSGEEIGPRFALTWPLAMRPGNDFREQSLAVLHDGSMTRQMLKGFGQAGFFGGEPDREATFGTGPVEWAGMNVSYFLGAVLPDHPTQARARFVSTRPGEAAVVQLYFDPVRLPPGQPTERLFRAYIGPKEPARLEAVSPGLVLSIDLGWSWIVPLTRFFNWLLAVLHLFIPNYGLAIIVLTVMVRVVTAPLTNKQMRSMERMRAIAPKLQELKEKHGDDRQKQSEEMMRLYKQEGVNPLGGCLPMVLQLPVFIGLFYALRSSIQLRQAPFVGWIDDLSAPDQLFVIPGIGLPFRVLPLVMGATMVLQQRITPMQQMDAAQQRMMMTMMPIVMTFVFYQFPSGLVLYWMVSNVLAIAHQLWIGRKLRK